MKKVFKKMLFVGALGSVLISCKKDDETVAPIYLPGEKPITDQALNGVIKGKVIGNTQEDSIAFSFDYLFPYEYGWDYSWWEDNGNGTVDIYVERYKDGDYDTYAYIDISGWEPGTPLTSADDYEIYMTDYFHLNNGKTLEYWGGADEGSNGGGITVNTIKLNENTGQFDFKVTIDFIERAPASKSSAFAYNSTYNPGKMTLEYSGRLRSDDVISKSGK